MSIWNQLYINIKSLISWQYCLKDINYINSLTVSMVSSQREESSCVMWLGLKCCLSEQIQYFFV